VEGDWAKSPADTMKKRSNATNDFIAGGFGFNLK
jgi:hypothetical protein